MGYQIPAVLLPGFKTLSMLSTEEVHAIAIVLGRLPVGGSARELHTAVEVEDDISKSAMNAVNAIFSLGSLLLNSKDSHKQLAKQLALDFTLESKKEVAQKQQEQLEQNLLILFGKSENLKKTFKAYYLLSENAHTYENSCIVTDMRMVFDDDFNQKIQSGLLVHQLKLEYVKNNESKAFFVNLDNEDLLKLREELNRALEKADCIKRDYDTIDFINLT